MLYRQVTTPPFARSVMTAPGKPTPARAGRWCCWGLPVRSHRSVIVRVVPATGDVVRHDVENRDAFSRTARSYNASSWMVSSGVSIVDEAGLQVKRGGVEVVGRRYGVGDPVGLVVAFEVARPPGAG